MGKRWQILDELRGLMMILLTIFFPLAFFDKVPLWLKHAPGNGIYIADLGAPVFFFVIGISYFISFTKRRQTMSNGALVIFFLKRYLLLMILGFVGEIVLGSGGFEFRWSVLEAIGLGGIFALPFMCASSKVRIVSAIMIPLVWQILISSGHENWALMYDFGGPWAVPAWSSIILFGSAVPEIKEKMEKDSFLPILVGAALMMSIIGKNAAIYFPINKHLVSFSYITLSIAVSIFSLAVFVAKEIVGCPPLRCLSMVGKNSFAIYVIAGLESFLVAKTLPASLAPGWVVVITAAVSLSCIAAAWAMDKRGAYFKI